jgi:peptidyl-prolyl cis-trans isomerase SurA
MIRAAAMPRWSRCGAVVLFLGLCFTARAEVVDRIVATIDGEPVTEHELRRYKQERGTGGADDAKVLDALITDKLLEKEIKAQGIAARDEDVARYIGEIQSRNGLDQERFNRVLSQQGITLEAYKARVKAEIEKVQLVNREIRQHVNVSPEEVKRYYEAHLADYGVSEQVRVREILFGVSPDADEDEVTHQRLKALEVREMALNGKDFAALARQFSDGASAEKGGELGTFGPGEMDKELDDVVFRLKRGEISEPIRTASGFHLLRVEERIASGHKDMKDVEESIRQDLYNQNLEQRFQDWLSKDLRERHHVEVLN